MTNFMDTETGEYFHRCDSDCEVVCEGCNAHHCTETKSDDGQYQFFDNGFDRHYLCLKCASKLDPQEHVYLRKAH